MPLNTPNGDSAEPSTLPFAIIYSDGDSVGKKLMPGSYDINDLGSYANAVSSLTLSPGLIAKLYSEPGFGGLVSVITTDSDNLPGKLQYYQKVTRSIVIEQVPAGPFVVLFYIIGNKPESIVLAPGQYHCGYGLPIKRFVAAYIPEGMYMTIEGVVRVPFLTHSRVFTPIDAMFPSSMAVFLRDPEIIDNSSVYLFSRNDLVGRKLGIGSYEADQLGDQFISIYKPPGLIAKLFENEGFSGTMRLISDNTFLLIDIWMVLSEINWVAGRSLIIMALDPQPDPPEPFVRILADSATPSLKLVAGRYDKDQLGLYDDRIHSIDIPSSLVVRLFEDSGFSGHSRLLSASSPDLGSFSAIASSIIIEKAPTIPVVAVFAEGDKKGMVLLPGKYDNAYIGVYNKMIVAASVPEGLTLTLFENDNFSGINKIINAGDTIPEEFRAFASSLIVGSVIQEEQTAIPDLPGLKATLYEKGGFKGKSLNITPGKYDMSQLTIGSTISSIQIPEGLRVTLFAGQGFTGASKVLYKNATSLKELGNKVGSAIAEPVVAIYAGKNYKDEVQYLTEGEYSSTKLGKSGNEPIKSLRLPKGLSVTLSGLKEINANTASLGDVNDTPILIRVGRSRR